MQDGKMIPRGAAAAVLVLIGILAVPALAAPPPTDPDWPCQQRLVPELGAGAFWTGPPLDGAGDWKAEPRVSELVDRLSPRTVAAEDGVVAIGAFADAIAADPDRKRLLTLLFAGLLAETNQERSDVITRLKELGKRQHDLADIASHASEELQHIPADATGDAAAKRTDLEQRFQFVTQAFQNTQRTMRYACEAPTRLEARLGRYAQAIQSRL